MRFEKPPAQQDALADAEAIVTTNLLGPIRLTAALLPLLEKQPTPPSERLSGLAFVPLAPPQPIAPPRPRCIRTPDRCATSSRGTSTEVIELIPPYVATHLLNGAADPRAMPLDRFIAEAMEILKTQPDAVEICVENVKRMRFAAESGNYKAVFSKAPTGE